MRNIKFLRPRKDQRGFTLVELVVVLGIMAALAAVVVPVVARFAGRGDTEANSTEVQTVQSAFDLYMSDNSLSAISASATSTSAWGAIDPGSVGVFMYPGYMRQASTKCDYTWGVDGTVAQGTCP